MSAQTPLKIDFQVLENTLISHIYRRFWGQEWKGYSVPNDVFRSIASNAKRISDGFTQDRRKMKSNYYETKEARSGYLLYFHLANVQRVLAVLKEMFSEGLPQKPLRVLDMGAGMGAVAWALKVYSEKFGLKIESIVMTDKNKNTLHESQLLWESWMKEHETPTPAQFKIMDVADPRTPAQLKKMGQFDVVFFANMINELGFEPTQMAKMLKFYEKDMLNPQTGKLVLVEPALLSTSKKLTHLRDVCLETWENSFISYPCFHSEYCPLNKEKRDWCHFDVEWDPPLMRKKIERFLDHRPGKLKFSYVVFEKQKPVFKHKKHRVISDILEVERGGYSAILCTKEGKQLLPTATHKRDLIKKYGDLYRGFVL